MRLYEAMVVMRPELDEEATTALAERLAAALTAAGASLVSLDRWGKRRLAYEIDHCREGQYLLYTFRGEATAARELEHVCKINESILRHLVVVRTEPLAPPAAAQAPVEAAQAPAPAEAEAASPPPAETGR